MDAQQATQQGFAEGGHVVLRPVKEDDLRELARLLAENPYERERLPWTYQRLKKKFEDKDKPGLWDKERKTYVVLRKSGGVVGFIQETVWQSGKHWCELHVADRLADRDTLGADLVQAYFAYMQKWYRPWRISFAILALEQQKADWLTSAGFEKELLFEQAVFYEGKPEALCYFTWISDWALAARAGNFVVPGEGDEGSGD